MRVFTIGHSTHPIEEFVELLTINDVIKLVDVRTVAKSRHNPQFNEDAMEESLPAVGISYERMTELGGLRHSRNDSPNGGWRNASFRGYADYMLTQDFADAVDTLVEKGRDNDLAIMCAEAVPWRCHRSLVGDALLVRGIEVLDIMSPKSTRPHTLTRFAKVDGTRVSYPPEGDDA